MFSQTFCVISLTVLYLLEWFFQPHSIEELTKQKIYVLNFTFKAKNNNGTFSQKSL
jgi:hypothetical protein